MEQLHNDLPDARWSWGTCDGLFTPRPLGPLLDLAAQLGGELEELSRAGAAREDLFRALLRQVSEPGTLNVLVVEDVHWADEATVNLLRFLGRRLRMRRCCWLSLTATMAWRRTKCFVLRSVTWPRSDDPAGGAGTAVCGCGAGPGWRERA